MKNIFSVLKKLNDSFFDGLKTNTLNNMLKKTGPNKNEPVSPLIQKMKELDKLSKELDEDLKKYEP